MDAVWNWIANFTIRALYPRNGNPVCNTYEAGWAPESDRKILRGEKYFPSPDLPFSIILSIPTTSFRDWRF